LSRSWAISLRPSFESSEIAQPRYQVRRANLVVSEVPDHLRTLRRRTSFTDASFYALAVCGDSVRPSITLCGQHQTSIPSPSIVKRAVSGLTHCKMFSTVPDAK